MMPVNVAAGTPRIVVKAGGAVAGAGGRALVEAIKSLRGHGLQVVLVHGGGPQVSGWLERVGLPARFHNGRRITDPAALEVVEMVLSAQVNKAWVAALQRAGVPAAGISGRDGGLMVVEPRVEDGVAMGRVGRVRRVDPSLLHALLQHGYCPVVSPVSAGEQGDAYNVNADEAAAAVASALGARALLLLTDVPGLLRDPRDRTSLVPCLTAAEAGRLLEQESVQGGMRPKLEAALSALLGGVTSVHLLDGTDPSAIRQAVAALVGAGAPMPGTTISAAAAPAAAGQAAAWMQRGQAVLMNNYGRLPMVLAAGRGALVQDVDGQTWLDFVSGLAVNSLGHGHPDVAAALAEQAQRLIHCSNLYWIPQQIELAEHLCALTGMERWFFANSGAEANEAAIKLARRWGIQTRGPDAFEIITATHSFHGRTLAALSATGQAKYQDGFGPLVPGFRHVPYGDLDAAAAAVSERTCAVLLEPVQGEGGVHVPPPGYLRGLRRLCDERGVLLILDEVQTGIGRTGRWLACQHEGVLPDVVTLAKALANGVPIGAVGARGAAAAVLAPGTHASTFGGNPLACAAALATLRVMERDGLVERAAVLGEHALARLRAVAAQLPRGWVVDVRGLGLMLAVEVAGGAARVAEGCRRRGLLVNAVGDRVVRLLPPLAISRELLDRGLDILADALREVAGEAA